MGNWKLEIAKMVIYMAFPVTSFYVYHQVGIFLPSQSINDIYDRWWILGGKVFPETP